MEEMLGNIAGARQVFERWMEWQPEEQAWPPRAPEIPLPPPGSASGLLHLEERSQPPWAGSPAPPAAAPTHSHPCALPRLLWGCSGTVRLSGAVFLCFQFVSWSWFTAQGVLSPTSSRHAPGAPSGSAPVAGVRTQGGQGPSVPGMPTEARPALGGLGCRGRAPAREGLRQDRQPCAGPWLPSTKGDLPR